MRRRGSAWRGALLLVALGASGLCSAAPAAKPDRGALSAACLSQRAAKDCLALGDLLETGKVRSHFPEEPGLYFALGCERGEAAACERAQPWGKRYPDYEELEGDAGCMLRDNGFACEEVAIALRDEGGPKGQALAKVRFRRALTLYRRGCAKKDAQSCEGMSRVLLGGFGVGKDVAGAGRALSRACALGLAGACDEAAGRARGAKALGLSARACALPPRSPHACFHFARQSERAGLTSKTVDARYQDACALLSFEACDALLRRDPTLHPQEPALAQAFRRWCEAGTPRACAALKGTAPVAAPAATESVLLRLGRALYFDPALSRPAGKACASCHAPQAGYSDPNHARATSAGAVAGTSGARNAPSAAYARFSPPFHYDPRVKSYVGGAFWDGRGVDLEDQAQGPLLDPHEMNQKDAAAVVAVVKRRPYAGLFREAFGEGALGDAARGLRAVTRAVAAFERSPALASFSSKYDAFLRGEATLSEKERKGLALFEDPRKGNCASCHPSRPQPDGSPPLFTDFGYDNLGIPKEPHTAGRGVDLGLGGRLSLPSEDGKFKAPTLRNVALTAPYGHNGYFATLKDVVHFYNTRDVASWPAPEVSATVNHRDLGNLHLTAREEDCLVAFLGTLSDGFSAPRAPVARAR